MTQISRQMEIGGLTGVNRHWNCERKGLEAIFSSEKDGRVIEVFTGTGGIAAGVLLSTLGLVRADAPQALGVWENTVYSSLAFEALGVLLLICGAGILTFVSRHRETKSQRTLASMTPVNSGDDSFTDVKGRDDRRRILGPGFRTGIVAFIQSLLLVALYSGFVQEFESSTTMQIWVRSNLPIGQSVLNWEGVLILSVSLGIMLLQFLPGRFLSEE